MAAKGYQVSIMRSPASEPARPRVAPPESTRDERLCILPLSLGPAPSPHPVLGRQTRPTLFTRGLLGMDRERDRQVRVRTDESERRAGSSGSSGELLGVHRCDAEGWRVVVTRVRQPEMRESGSSEPRVPREEHEGPVQPRENKPWRRTLQRAQNGSGTANPIRPQSRPQPTFNSGSTRHFGRFGGSDSAE